MTENIEIGEGRMLYPKEVQHVLKTLKKDWKGADADAEKTNNTD